MKIAVVGVGYVGLVAAACLAEGGNHVVCVDNDKKKIKDLNHGKIPIYEPGLTEIVKHNETAGRLRFTTDLKDGVDNSFIKDIRVASMQLAAYLVSSALAGSIKIIRLFFRINGEYNCFSNSITAGFVVPIITRSGFIKSSTAEPSLRNSGLLT